MTFHILARLAPILLFLTAGCGQSEPESPDDDGSSANVRFAGGHDTDPRDQGRPVALIAAALGVEDQVFRDAFSKVQPARNGRPSHEEAQRNKQVLMTALAPHGITNDRLDEVSDYYRYRPQDEEVWTVKPASAKAIIEDGQVTGFKIISGGAGYSSAPTVSIPGHPDVRVKATAEFTKDLRTNGRISKLTLVTE